MAFVRPWAFSCASKKALAAWRIKPPGRCRVPKLVLSCLDIYFVNSLPFFRSPPNSVNYLDKPPFFSAYYSVYCHQHIYHCSLPCFKAWYGYFTAPTSKVSIAPFCFAFQTASIFLTVSLYLVHAVLCSLETGIVELIFLFLWYGKPCSFLQQVMFVKLLCFAEYLAVCELCTSEIGFFWDIKPNKYLL